MSTIRANAIVDSAGTGAPTFTNGIKADTITDNAGTGAPNFSNGFQVAGSIGTSGQVLTSNGSGAPSWSNLSTSQVTTAYASVTAGAVGSFMFGTPGVSTLLNYGDTVAGSGIRAGSVTAGGTSSDTVGQSGTWRYLGYQASGTMRWSLLMRIS